MSIEEALELNKKLKANTETKIDPKDNKAEKSKAIAENKDENKKLETWSEKVEENGDKTRPQSRKRSRQSQSFTLMQKCIESFQQFFHVLVKQKLFLDDRTNERCFQSLLKRNSEDDENIQNFYDEDQADCSPTISIENYEKDTINTFVAACHLLEEFASFPMYGEKSIQHANGEDGNFFSFLLFTHA